MSSCEASRGQKQKIRYSVPVASNYVTVKWDEFLADDAEALPHH